MTSKHKDAIPAIPPALGEANQKLRILEERYLNLLRKFQVAEENMVANNRRFNEEIRTVNDDIKELKNTFMDINNKLALIVDEISQCAKKNDVNYIKRYVELWQPLNFITKKEAKQQIDELRKV